MAALYIALLLGVVAAVGVFTTVSAFNPPAPTNADVVEGRLRVYENALPLSVTEIELREPFGERVLRPLAKRVGKLVEQSMPEKARQSIAHNLMIAGRPGGMSAGDFIAMRYVLTAVLCCFGILVGVLTHNPIALALLAAVGAAVGLYGPVFWLRMKLNSRRSDIQTALPDVLDVLVVCVEAGLTFEAAMEKVVEKFENALADEFSRVMQEVRLGRARLEALNDMGERTGVDELNNFVQAIIQSEQLGSGIGRILKIQAEEIRAKRLITAQERGARASLKMLIPMLACIFPTLWVILLGPAALLAMRFLRGG
jgi:tight adherence protein C